MIREVDSALLISMEFLQEKGISNQTILNGVSRNKAGKTDNWVSRYLNAQLFINYNSLPKQSKKKLPDASYLTDLAKIKEFEVSEENEKTQKEQKLSELAKSIEERFNAYFVKHLASFAGKVNREEAVRLAKKTEMLLWLIQLSKTYSKKLLFEAQLLIENAPVSYKNYFSFAPVLSQIAQAQATDTLYASMLHGNIGKANAKKIFEDHLSGKALIAWYGSPTKPSIKRVFRLYEKMAETRTDWPKLCLRAVGKFLNKPEIKQIWYEARHGRSAARNFMEPIIKRRKASRPDAVWTCDGTTVQLVFVNQKNKTQQALYFYLATDSYSGAIVGHHLGLTENTGIVTTTLKNAIKNTNYRPSFLGYDNGKANIGVEVQGMMSKMARVHFPCEPYNGRAKKVERVILELEQRYLRYHEFFKGGNITTKSLNSQANPEFLIQLQKSGKLPNLAEVIQAFEESIFAYNHEKLDKGYSRWERYMEPHAERQPVTPLDYTSLFMNQRRQKARYLNYGIEIEVNAEKYTYQVQQPDGSPDYDFYRQHLEQRFEVHADNDDLSLIALYQNGTFITYAFRKKEYAEAPTEQRAGERAELQKELKGRKKHLDESNKAYVDIAREIQEESIPEMGHKSLFKDLLNKMEGRMQDEHLGLEISPDTDDFEAQFFKLLNK